MGRPATFEVTVLGADKCAADLEAIGRRARNSGPLMQEIKELLFVQQKARVESGADWAPLAPSTVARKVRQGSNSAILRDEPRMANGQPTRKPDSLWDTVTRRSAQGKSVTATRTRAKYGLRADGNAKFFYARFFNYGNGKGGPPRQLLGLTPENQGQIVERIVLWLEKVVNGV